MSKIKERFPKVVMQELWVKGKPHYVTATEIEERVEAENKKVRDELRVMIEESSKLLEDMLNVKWNRKWIK